MAAVATTESVELLRIILGFVFLFSGLIKVDDLNGFARIASSYSLVPRSLAPAAKAAAYVIPFTEMVAGGLLIASVLVKLVLVYVAVSLFGYMTLQSYELYQQNQMDNCGCYGTAIDVELSWGQVGKNLALLLVAILLFISSL